LDPNHIQVRGRTVGRSHRRASPQNLPIQPYPSGPWPSAPAADDGRLWESRALL